MAAVVEKDYIFSRTETKEWEFRVSVEGLTQNLTGWKLFFTLKEELSDEDSAAVIKKDITDHYSAEEGKSRVSLTSADTNRVGNYYYDISIVSPAGKKWVLLAGRMTFEEVCGRRLS
jgi:hypothetical protein